MPEVSSPRKGSLQYHPRVRAKRIYPAISAFPETEKPKTLLFAGYKVGMTHAMLLDNRKESPTFGQEISKPVTILECPSLKVLGLRTYGKTTKGLKVLTEALVKELPKDLERKVRIKNVRTEEKLSQIESNLPKVSNLRLIVLTQPRLSGIGKKKPEVFEVGIGGKDPREKFEYAKSLMGKEIKPSDVMREGELVDVMAVTKGKGTVGVVERYGVRIQNRHAKQKLRHVGTLGSQTPRRVRWTAPMAGQLGFLTRTELNKRVLKIGEGKDITPKGGFKRYGVVKENYVLLEGSVPGPKKRLIMLRPAIRPSRLKLLVPEVREIVK